MATSDSKQVRDADRLKNTKAVTSSSESTTYSPLGPTVKTIPSPASDIFGSIGSVGIMPPSLILDSRLVPRGDATDPSTGECMLPAGGSAGEVERFGDAGMAGTLFAAMAEASVSLASL